MPCWTSIDRFFRLTAVRATGNWIVLLKGQPFHPPILSEVRQLLLSEQSRHK
jgi:hypothetical protein